MLRREKKILLSPVGEYNFSILDEDLNLIVDAEEDYYIYFKNVTFLPNGSLKGRYLGDNPKTIIDRYCKNAMFTENGWVMDRKNIRTAKLVAVKNRDGVVVVIK